MQRPISRRSSDLATAGDPPRRPHAATGRLQQPLDAGPVLGPDRRRSSRLLGSSDSAATQEDAANFGTSPASADRDEVGGRKVGPGRGAGTEREANEDVERWVDPGQLYHATDAAKVRMTASVTRSNSGPQHQTLYHRSASTQHIPTHKSGNPHHRHQQQHQPLRDSPLGVAMGPVSEVTVMGGGGGIRRSKSDVQDFFMLVGEGEESRPAIGGGGEISPANGRKNKLANSLVKRSRSFHKLFTTSMLSRSKEYSFQ